MTDNDLGQSHGDEAPGRKSVLVKKLGFTTLYEPVNEQPPIADVVFVHGLQGHPWRTWRYKGKPEPAQGSHRSPRRSIFSRSNSKDKQNKAEYKRVFWPADLLPLDHPNVRILTYGYDSEITKWFAGAANQMSIEQHANSFLISLEAERRQFQGRPIVFVVHSLGGLLVKQAICQSKAEGHHIHLRDVFNSLHAILFFGTPHRGSKDAVVGKILMTIAQAAQFDANGALLKVLNPSTGKEKLDNLDSSFAQVLDEKDIRISTFQESQGKAGTWIANGKVVPDYSSALQIAKYEIKDSVIANHMDMCRFAGVDDDGYIKAKHALRYHLGRLQGKPVPPLQSFGTTEPSVEVVNTSAIAGMVPIPSCNDVTQWLRSPDDKLAKEVSKSLYFEDIGARKHQVYEDILDSCSWVWADVSTLSFPEWLSAGSGPYWITGLPGSGKSTLMKYVVNHYKTKELLSRNPSDRDWKIVSFFFDFRAGKGLSNSFEGLMRSILFQLTRAIPDLSRSLNDYGSTEFEIEQGLQWNVQTLRAALRKIITDCPSNICLFVDGLDEYEDNYLDLLDFFRSPDIDASDPLRPTIKVCLASRPEPLLLVHLQGCPRFRMQDHNFASILAYSSHRLAPIAQLENADSLSNMAQRIADMARGVFVWSRLATDDLLNSWARGLSRSDLEERLELLPQDLEAMYSRILNRIEQQDRYEACMMLQFVCFSRRILTVEELFIAIELTTVRSNVSVQEINQETANRFRRRLLAMTGGLIHVTDPTPRSPANPLPPSDRIVQMSQVRLLHKTLGTLLRRPDWLRGFYFEESPTLYRGNEAWLRVLSRYIDVECSKIKDSHPKTRSDDILRCFEDVGVYAYLFEKEAGSSSFNLLDQILTSRNLNSLTTSSGWVAETPLSYAVAFGLKHYVQHLITLGADVHELQGGAMHTAINPIMKKNQIEILDILLGHGAKVDDSVLLRAIKWSPLHVFRRLLNVRNDRIANMRIKMDTGEEIGPLYAVCVLGNIHAKAIIPFFIESGVDVNESSGPLGTPLHAAVANIFPLTPIISLLLDNGADVNIDGPMGKPLDLFLIRHLSLDREFDKMFSKRLSPLSKRSENIFQLLIDRGATSSFVDRDGVLRIREESIEFFDFITTMREKIRLIREQQGKGITEGLD